MFAMASPVLLSSEVAPFEALNAGILAQESKGRFARAPWGESPSLWKSALQKAIRRGEIEKAQEAAVMLMLIPTSRAQSNLMNRLRTISLEDIGIAFYDELPLLDDLLKRAEVQRDKCFANPSDELVATYRLTILQAVTLLASSPKKTRFLSHCLSTFCKVPSRDWIHQHHFPDLSPPLYSSLPEALEIRSLQAFETVYDYYGEKQSRKKGFSFPAKEARAVFDAVVALRPTSKPSLDVLREWFKRGYSENELCVYSAVLIALFRKQYPIRTLPPLIDHMGPFLALRNRGRAFEPLDVARDQHTEVGRKRKRGASHFALEGSVVIPELDVPQPLAERLKQAYIGFKLASDDSSIPPVEEWRGQIITVNRLHFTAAGKAQRGNKTAQTYIGTVPSFSSTSLFLKGPYPNAEGWNVQAYIDSIKPLFGLHPIGMIRVKENGPPMRRFLLMRDLNEGSYAVDDEGIVKAKSAAALRANQVLAAGGFKGLPDAEQVARILLFRAVWGVSDSNGNNLVYRADEKKWYSVDENVMFSKKSAEKLEHFSLVAQNHRSTSYCSWLKEYDLSDELAEWKEAILSGAVDEPPVGALASVVKKIEFVQMNYGSF